MQLTAVHDAATLVRALNAHLPPDIRVNDVTEAPDGFHARFHATRKSYRYQIRNRPIANVFTRSYEWHIPEPLDCAAMRRGLEYMLGEHDFAAFQSVGTSVPSSIRTLTRAEVVEMGDGLMAVELTGTGFLRHMVRAITGTLVEVGRGWRPAASIPDLLAGRRRADAGATAPPHGLILVAVDYD